jgi:hypothetical protein
MSQHMQLWGCEIKNKVKIERIKVKIEGVTSPYVETLYGKAPEIIFYHKNPITRRLHMFLTCVALGLALNA